MSQILFFPVVLAHKLIPSYVLFYMFTICVVPQIIYIGCAYATVYMIYAKFKATYDGNHDTFRVEFLVVPVGGLAFLVNHDFSPLEVKPCSSDSWTQCDFLPQLAASVCAM